MSNYADGLLVRIQDATSCLLKFELQNCSCKCIAVDQSIFHVSHSDFFIAAAAVNNPEYQCVVNFVSDFRCNRIIKLIRPADTICIYVDITSLFQGRERVFSDNSDWIIYWGFPYLCDEIENYSYGAARITAS